MSLLGKRKRSNDEDTSQSHQLHPPKRRRRQPKGFCSGTMSTANQTENQLNAFVVKKIADPATKYLIYGYIRNNSSESTPNDINDIILYFYYDRYFDPPSAPKDWDESEKIIIKPRSDNIDDDYFNSDHKYQRVEVHEGEYDDEGGFFFGNYCSIVSHFIGIGNKHEIIVKDISLIVAENIDIYIENMTLESDCKGDWEGNIVLNENGRLWLNNCVIKVKETAIAVKENASLYVKDCIFEGYGQSECAIYASPFSKEMYIINSRFEGCATKRWFGADDDYFGCVDVECWNWNGHTAKHANLELFGFCNTFVGNFGYPFCRKLILGMEDDDGEIEWFKEWNDGQVHLEKNTVINHHVKDVEEVDGNKMYSKLFVDKNDHEKYEKVIAETTNSILISTNVL